MKSAKYKIVVEYITLTKKKVFLCIHEKYGKDKHPILIVVIFGQLL